MVQFATVEDIALQTDQVHNIMSHNVNRFIKSAILASGTSSINAAKTAS